MCEVCKAIRNRDRDYSCGLRHKRFICPATGASVKEEACRRRFLPQNCVNCLIPLAGASCEKCGYPIPDQEARAGFTTCEFCG